ncbi:hypothetical protein HYH03_009704 [Edaphochlamys debaryana]|uniref:Uncharacterized protein n=1 Tax=Edaphochlamys debaryana TaxID=47281 RepID=A0A835XXD6_9CHLO|nr:hypothetical protein HYH03_009704 [Edaphochlamys debaryana]|eukprot:KAG2491973.1 hypothetical protein HYH03_009704 [Edaphochlamys debaryana]
MELGDSLAPPWVRRGARGTAESTSPTEQAPEAACGPPLTPAQRRLLVAAGVGIPERLLSSRPSQQAQALAQQPVRGAWRAGATYRPALRAAATAALTAAAPQPMTPAVDVPAALSIDCWRKARSDWRDFQTSLCALWRSHESLARSRRKGLNQGDTNAAFARLMGHPDHVDPCDVSAAVASCRLQSCGPCTESEAGSDDVPPSLLLGAWDDAPIWVGSEAQLLPGRAALLCAICTQLFVGVFLPSPDGPDANWMCAGDMPRKYGFDSARIMCQGLLQGSGCHSPTHPHLRIFTFMVTALMAFVAKTPAAVQALGAATTGTTPGPLAALTSVPALAKLARATADTVDAATPNMELHLIPTDEYKFAETVVEAYCRAVMQAARDAEVQAEGSGPGLAEEPGSLPPEGSPAGGAESHARHSADRLAEALEAACRSRLAESGCALTQEVVDADPEAGDRARQKADGKYLKLVAGLLEALQADGGEGSVRAQDWIDMHSARRMASRLRLALLRARLGSWLPAELASIARAVCRPAVTSSAGEAGPGETKAAAQPGGAREEVEKLRLEAAELDLPATRAALARALVAAHLDQRPTRIAVCDPRAFALLASAAAVLCVARDQAWQAVQHAGRQGPEGPSEIPRAEDCGFFPGLLLRPGRAPGATAVDGTGPDRGEQGGGHGCNGRGRRATDAALEVELVPLSFPWPGCPQTADRIDRSLCTSLEQDLFARTLADKLESQGKVAVMCEVHYSPPALQVMLRVCVKALDILRAAGREAVLLPVVPDLRGCGSVRLFSRDLVQSVVDEDSDHRGAAQLYSTWRQRLRLASTTRTSKLLQDGCVAVDDEAGHLHTLAHAVMGDKDSFTPSIQELMVKRLDSISIPLKAAQREAELMLNEQLHEALEAELDVQQMGRYGLAYWIVEVDPANLNSPVVPGRVQGQGAAGEEGAGSEGGAKGTGWNWGDEGGDGGSFMDELD